MRSWRRKSWKITEAADKAISCIMVYTANREASYNIVKSKRKIRMGAIWQQNRRED